MKQQWGRNLVLIGFRCSGKSRVGLVVSQFLGMSLVDTDHLIELEAGCSIYELVAREGWSEFRKIEKKVISQVSQTTDQVIATGGGVVLDQENVQSLKQRGVLVWLQASVAAIKERMLRQKDFMKTRPSLTGVDPLSEVEELLREREPLYARASDAVVVTEGLSINQVAFRVARVFIDKKGI